MKQGTLIFDEYRDRYDIRFDLTEYGPAPRAIDRRGPWS